MGAMAQLAQLIVIEGIDGSGKGTQARELVARLTRAGRSATLLSFPRYSETFFGARVGDFLNGHFGALDTLPPFLVSLLYAGDRLESRPYLLAALEANEFVICDRYVTSNLAHQGSKVTGPDQKQIWDWIEKVEYGIFQLPRPDKVFWLDVPVDIAAKLIEAKSPRDYTSAAADIQEADHSHLSAAYRAYRELSGQNGWQRIECTRNSQLRLATDIADELYQVVAG
jgi:dTMP kinase